MGLSPAEVTAGAAMAHLALAALEPHGVDLAARPRLPSNRRTRATHRDEERPMHRSAMETGKLFFDTYAVSLSAGTVAEIGALDINGSLKKVCPPNLTYTGVDCVPGNGVNVVLDDPYQLPFPDDEFDFVVCSSVFEHSEMFWLLFLEVIRVLRPSGVFYLNVPSNGYFHRYPVDCWRFYPDSGRALVSWARRHQYDLVLLESFIGRQNKEVWNDFVAVFLKDARYLGQYPQRIIDS